MERPLHDNPSSIPSSPVERLLSRRRQLQQTGYVLVALLLASVLLARGGRNGPADDWAAFDRKRAVVLSVAMDGSLSVRTADGAEATLKPLGVDFPTQAGPNHSTAAPSAPAPPAAPRASRYLAARVLAEEVTLRLEPTQTRSEDGALLAYVFVNDTDILNLDMIRDGEAFADRRLPHSFKTQFEQAEADARKKGRGMWKDLTDAQVPAWRQEWLKQMREKKQRVEGTTK